MRVIEAELPSGSKREERRAELAEAALATLGELGYARTGLRDIAQNGVFSHGILHYYFKDKTDLVLCGIRQYKARCVKRYDGVLATSTTFDMLMAGFLERLGDSVRSDAPMHRLWYDLRAQALFDAEFRGDVMSIDKRLEAMTARVMARFGELAGRSVLLPPEVMYATFDGLFQQCLLRHIHGDAGAIEAMQATARSVIESTFDAAPAAVTASLARSRGATPRMRAAGSASQGKR